MRKIALLTLSLLRFATLASAQIPTAGNVFFGYSYYNTNLSPIDRANTNGWQASVEGKFLPWVGIVGDVSSHYGSQNFEAFFLAANSRPLLSFNRGRNRAQLSVRAARVRLGGKIPAICRGSDWRKPRQREGRQLRHLFRQRPRRRHRLQTHPGGSLAAPGRLRANPFLQHNTEQPPTGDRHRYSVLEIRVRVHFQVGCLHESSLPPAASLIVSYEQSSHSYAFAAVRGEAGQCRRSGENGGGSHDRTCGPASRSAPPLVHGRG